MDRWADGQVRELVDRWAGMQTGRLAVGQVGRQAGAQVGRWAG